MLEKVLLRAFLMLYASDFEGDDDRHPYQSGKSRSAEKRAFTLLSSVSWQWHQALIGLPQTPTGRWLKQYIEREFTHFCFYNTQLPKVFRLIHRVIACLAYFIVQVQNTIF